MSIKSASFAFYHTQNVAGQAKNRVIAPSHKKLPIIDPYSDSCDCKQEKKGKL